jgi:hypothetical protein
LIYKTDKYKALMMCPWVVGIGALASVQVGQGVGGGDRAATDRAARSALTRGFGGRAYTRPLFGST